MGDKLLDRVRVPENYADLDVAYEGTSGEIRTAEQGEGVVSGDNLSV